MIETFLAWLFGFLVAGLSAFKRMQREAGAEDERERADEANRERLKRQNEIALKPVTNAELDKKLRDGTF